MAKKKIKIEDEFEEVSKIHANSWGKDDIPEGATHFELEVDTSQCYYESDTPSYIISFYKKK